MENELELATEMQGFDREEVGENLSDPFDPEDISIDSKVITMETILRRLTQGTIILNPDFQRKEVWIPTKKSQLIESLMLKIPLPMFYVSADEKSNYTVVDGLQRLSTIRSFVLGDDFLKNQENIAKKGEGFKLQNLEFWKEFNGKTFNDLPTHLKNRIVETELSFTIINPGTPEEVKRNIFKRINTGGDPLSDQEIRNALYIGSATGLLKELADMESFKKATGNSINSLRAEDQEAILRFLAFLVRDYTSYKKTLSADVLLSDTMVIINAHPRYNNRDFKKLVNAKNFMEEDIIKENIDNIKPLFDLAMQRSHQLFEKHTFRRSYGEKKRTPINKCLLEMWGVLLAQITQAHFERILSKQHEFLGAYYNILEKGDFQTNISRDSLKVKSVEERFSAIKTLIYQYENQ